MTPYHQRWQAYCRATIMIIKASKGKPDHMTNLKTAFLKKHNRLISFLLSILGFSAASVFNGCAYGTPVENGVPNASFIVKGTVRSENNSLLIPHIKVVMGYDRTSTRDKMYLEFLGSS